MKRVPLFAVLGVLFLGACADDQITSPTLRPQSDIDVNDPRGELRVEIRYNGALQVSNAPVADNDCQILVDVNIPNWSGNAVGFCERTRTAITSPNTYGSRPWIYDGYTYPTLASNIPVVVTAGQTTVQVYEIGALTGIISGSVTIDGLPAKSPYTICLSTGGCSYFPRNDGTFRLITKPGAGTAVIRTNQNTTIGTFAYTAVQGQNVAVGAQAVSDPRGTLRAEVRFNGQLYSPQTAAADNDCQILVDVSVPPWSGNAVGLCEGTRTTTVAAGTYGARVWIYDGYTYPTVASSIPVVVTAGQTTTQVFEVGAMTGLVAGKVIIDGQPARSPFTVCLSTGGCSYFPRADGTFKLITRPGAGTGVIRSNLGTLLGSFSFTAVQGQLVTVADQAVSDPRGTLILEVRYNGQLFNNQSPIADNDCQILVDVSVPSWSGNAVGFCERTRTTTVAPGTYGARAWLYDGYTYPTILPNIPVVVTNGQTNTQVVDVGAVTAIVSGKVLVNGQPATSAYRVCLSTGGCSNFQSGGGNFKLITKPGPGTGAVWNNIGVLLTNFTYSSTPGEVKPIGTIGGDDSPPVITPTIAGTEGAAGWYTSNITVSWSVTDAQSAITNPVGCAATTVSADTDGLTLTCTAKSEGGTSTKSVTVKRDASAPVIVPTVSGTLGSNGWYRSNVTVALAASDDRSGIASSSGCVATTIATDIAIASYTCSATNGAGLTSSHTETVKRDATGPSIAYSGNLGTYQVDQQVAIGCAASDAMSGLAAHSCANISGAAYTFALGTHNFSATASDRAGNSSSAATSFTITVAPASLCALTRSFVSQHGIANALCQKLDALARAHDRGQIDREAKAYINQVEAQKGKAISNAHADILIALAGAL